MSAHEILVRPSGSHPDLSMLNNEWGIASYPLVPVMKPSEK
jgi:hypothetical protein